MTKSESYPDCYKCGAAVEARDNQALVRFEGEEILFQRVPMGVCKGCGERFLTSRVARLMEQAALLCRAPGDLGPGGILALREVLDLSRDALAAKLGVSAQTIFRWETGRSKPARWARERFESVLKKAARKTGRRAS